MRASGRLSIKSLCASHGHSLAQRKVARAEQDGSHSDSQQKLSIAHTHCSQAAEEQPGSWNEKLQHESPLVSMALQVQSGLQPKSTHVLSPHQPLQNSKRAASQTSPWSTTPLPQSLAESCPLSSSPPPQPHSRSPRRAAGASILSGVSCIASRSNILPVPCDHRRRPSGTAVGYR